MGWAFKANTNDSRESPAIYVAEKLYKAGSNLLIYDPMVSQESIFTDISFYWNGILTISQERIRVLKNAPRFATIDVTVILTEWSEFKNLDFENSMVLDGRNLLDKSILERNSL